MTIRRWVELVGRTGAGALTAEISFECSRNNAAGAELGTFVMIIVVLRFAGALLREIRAPLQRGHRLPQGELGRGA